MKVDFSIEIVNVDGVAYKHPDPVKAEQGINMTLGYVAMTALTGITEKDKDLTGEDKFKLGILAQEVYGVGEVDISPEDAVKIKERIGTAYGPIVIAQAFTLLN